MAHVFILTSFRERKQRKIKENMSTHDFPKRKNITTIVAME